MNRAEKRRIEREIDKLKLQPGVGKGWRLTTMTRMGKFPYPIKEHTRPIDIDQLEHESLETRIRMGIK